MINVPIAIVVLLTLVREVPESRDESADRRIDVVGAALATAGLGLLVYGLIEMNGAHVSARALLAAAAGIAALAAFIVFERRTPDPMVRYDLFASRTFTVANVYTFFLYAALGGSLYFVPFVLINVHHYTPTAAGAALLPFIFIMVVSSRWSGGLVARIGPRLPLHPRRRPGGSRLSRVRAAGQRRIVLDYLLTRRDDSRPRRRALRRSADDDRDGCGARRAFRRRIGRE